MKTDKSRIVLVFSILCTALFLAGLIAGMIGPIFIHPVTVLKIWGNQIFGELINTDWTGVQETIVMHIRLPRIILSLMVGMGLAIAGASMQGLFRNPMAEPYVLGMSSGAAVGAALAMVLGVGKLLGGFAVPGLAFITTTMTIFTVYNIARIEGKVPTEMLLLSGIAVGLFLSSVVSFLKIIASDEALRDVVMWLMGSFSRASWSDVQLAAVPLIIGIAVIYAFSRELNALQFGEETALHLGMNVERVKCILLVASALVTAASISLCGIIGFVGLIVPHIMRLIIGGDHRFLLPASALAGGLFLAFADTLARTIVAPTEIPVGIITAAIGAPYFIYLLKRRKKAVSWW